MIPNAVNTCLGDGQPIHYVTATVIDTHHIPTRLPRMADGAHSAAKTGTVAELGPIPIPKTKRATKRCCQELVTVCQMQTRKEITVVMKIAPRRPK